MTMAIWALATYSIVATATQLGSILIATSKCRKPRSISRPAKSQTALGLVGLTRYLRRSRWRAKHARDCTDAPSDVAGVSLVRPVCGLENYIEETLRSAFHLDYPRYEIIFCAASAHDAAVPLVRQLIAAHPHIAARLLTGNETISDNPKLNNVCKGWRAAAYDWIVMADSNVLMPRDYIERLLAAWPRIPASSARRPPVAVRRDSGRSSNVRSSIPTSWMAIYVGRDRLRLCPGQVDALSAQPDRAGRRHSIARGRGRGGRGHDQARARLGASRSPRRRAVRAAPGLPLRGRSMGASTAVGKAAAGLVSAVLCAGDFERQSRPAHGRRLCRRGAGPAFGQRCCARRDLVWRRSRARARSRLASEPQVARRLDAA